MTQKKTQGIMIAAVKSGSGKTMMTCALLEALKQRGMHPMAYKCGPDYIDPMFHKTVIGIPSRNLDTFFADEDVIKRLYAQNSRYTDCVVMEGVMGLYDGLGGVRKEGSAYHLAQTLQTPVILVVDARGMGRSLIALIAGFLKYDESRLIKGVILNRITSYFYETMSKEIEKVLKIPVLGYFPEFKHLELESRHLGLKLPNEIKDLKEQLAFAAAQMEKSVNIDRILEIAASCAACAVEETEDERIKVSESDKKVRIAIAKDDAFCFYYDDNLDLLEKMGAELVPFSPLKDKKLPDNVSGLILGGGYPELYAFELEANSRMRKAIKNAIAKGLPSIAECGGFMYLHQTLTDAKGDRYQMCDVIHETCEYKGKSVRFGYIEVKEKQADFLPEGTGIRGHEFHYYDSTDPGDSCQAEKPVTEASWDCIHSGADHWWGFPHLYYLSNPKYAEAFIEKAMKYDRNK